MELMQVLENTVVILTVASLVVALIRLLLLAPLDKKLDNHANKILTQIEHNLLSQLTKRIEAIEEKAEDRSRQGILWSKALTMSLKAQGLENLPDPDMYRIDAHIIQHRGDC